MACWAQFILTWKFGEETKCWKLTCRMTGNNGSWSEAEFLDVTGTKVLRVFLLAVHGHLYWRILHPPPPWEKVVWNWFVMKTLYKETSNLRTLKIMPGNLKKIYVHAFGFSVYPCRPECDTAYIKTESKCPLLPACIQSPSLPTWMQRVHT